MALFIAFILDLDFTMQLHALPQTTILSGNQRLDLSRPHIMGILNVTPDSFSDGGQYQFVENAVARALHMVEQGATIIDIGGESTRPGAAHVAVDEELARVIPVVEALASHQCTWISIDTSEPQVIQQAVQAGAHIWNDVRALTRPGALHMAAKLNIPVILMHMRGEPTTMNQMASYDDLMHEVIAELSEKVEQAVQAGVERDRIIIDPGFGFAKNTDHNVELLNQLWQLHQFGLPILSGLSRKRFIGEITAQQKATDRVIGSVMGHLLSIQQGASIVRVHDVSETKQALDLWMKL